VPRAVFHRSGHPVTVALPAAVEDVHLRHGDV
jgi:hypothetical protein